MVRFLSLRVFYFQLLASLVFRIIRSLVVFFIAAVFISEATFRVARFISQVPIPRLFQKGLFLGAKLCYLSFFPRGVRFLRLLPLQLRDNVLSQHKIVVWSRILFIFARFLFFDLWTGFHSFFPSFGDFQVCQIDQVEFGLFKTFFLLFSYEVEGVLSLRSSSLRKHYGLVVACSTNFIKKRAFFQVF